MPEMICRKKNAAVINKLRHESDLVMKIVNNFESEMLAEIEKWKSLKMAPVFYKFACQAISECVCSFETGAGVSFYLSYFKCQYSEEKHRFMFNVTFTFESAGGDIRTGELCYSF